MAIGYYTEGCKFRYAVKRLTTNWINKIVTKEGKKCGAISVIFCSDDYILSVNKEYLKHDYFTDIITFDYTENNVISGDLIISVDTVKSNSEKFGSTFERELHRVIIHGVLHLLGYKDKSPEDSLIMRAKEDEALTVLDSIVG